MNNTKIMIIEDEVIIAFSLKSKLKRLGFDVHGPVSSGLDAVELAKIVNPDFILVDINLMGELDGIESASMIKTIIPTRIIFTTGYQDQDIKKRAADLNPVGYLIKPVKIEEVLRLIKQN